MKKILFPLLLVAMLALVMLCSSCGSEPTEKAIFDPEALTGTYSREYEGTSINVFNWGEYISDGTEGTLDVNAAFEELTGITVNYTNYESNEAMYTKMKSGAVSYDIVIPSDYMIQRMVSEGMLQKLDFSKIDNYENVLPEYRGLYFDPEEAYSVPYMVNMTALIYNTTMVEETPTSWGIMWDERYADDILTFNNSRDAFSLAQLLLGQDVNSTNIADWDAAADKLKEQDAILQARVMDEVFNKMEAGNAAIAAYYAGDYLIMVEENEDLALVYPEEGTIFFVDSICIPSNAQNYEAALMYINFLLETQIATANAEAIVYTSPLINVQENEDYDYYKNEVLYPAEMPKLQYFTDLSVDVRTYYENLWEEILRESK